MPRQKSNKTVKSINFENIVLDQLESKCKKNGMNISTFVNSVIRKIVMSEREYYRQLTKHHASKMHEYKTLMETSNE